MKVFERLAGSLLFLMLGAVLSNATPTGLLYFGSTGVFASNDLSFISDDDDWNLAFSPASTLTFVGQTGKQRIVGSDDITRGYLNFGNDASSTTMFFDDGDSPHVGLLFSHFLPGIYSSAQCGLSPAPGQVCSPAGEVFNFTNTHTGSTLEISFDGSFADRGGESAFQGSIDVQFIGLNFQSVLHDSRFGAIFIGPASGTMAFGLESNNAVPEPGSAPLIALGLLTCSAAAMQRARSRR